MAGSVKAGKYKPGTESVVQAYSGCEIRPRQKTEVYDSEKRKSAW